MNHKLSAGTLDRLWADDSHWRAGVIYSCKDDPRLVVPKRYWKWGGWTMNFAHASARLLLMAIIVVAMIPAVVLAATQMWSVWFWLAYVVGLTASLCVLSAILASLKRFENAG